MKKRKEMFWKASIAIAIVLMLGISMTMAQPINANVMTEQIEEHCNFCGIVTGDGDDDESKLIICPAIQAEAPGIIEEVEGNWWFEHPIFTIIFLIFCFALGMIANKIIRGQ